MRSATVGGVGKGTVAEVVVGRPSMPPRNTKAGQTDVVANAGRKDVLVTRPSPLKLVGSNIHSVMVNGGFVIVLVQVPWLTVTKG